VSVPVLVPLERLFVMVIGGDVFEQSPDNDVRAEVHFLTDTSYLCREVLFERDSMNARR
jgi:hypothetical protein